MEADRDHVGAKEAYKCIGKDRVDLVARRGRKATRNESSLAAASN